ncbi:aminopeptidase N, partial [Proteus mirabilis]
MTQQRIAKYRKDYRAPDYTITDLHLDFILDKEKTQVTAISQCKRLATTVTPLVLDGEDLTLKSIFVNDVAWTHYKEENGKLIIDQLPEQFTLKIINEINPSANTPLEGLFAFTYNHLKL